MSLLPVGRPQVVWGQTGSGTVQLAPEWPSCRWWTGTDAPAASEPAGCDTWWGSPGESAPKGHAGTGV